MLKWLISILLCSPAVYAIPVTIYVVEETIYSTRDTPLLFAKWGILGIMTLLSIVFIWKR
jgi:hypothetical protein